MKKIDIILIKELFLLRYYKQYSKQVMKDFCDYIDGILSSINSLCYYPPCYSFSQFIERLESNMLSSHPNDFAIRKHFKDYLYKYKEFIYDERF